MPRSRRWMCRTRKRRAEELNAHAGVEPHERADRKHQETKHAEPGAMQSDSVSPPGEKVLTTAAKAGSSVPFFLFQDLKNARNIRWSDTRTREYHRLPHPFSLLSPNPTTTADLDSQTPSAATPYSHHSDPDPEYAPKQSRPQTPCAGHCETETNYAALHGTPAPHTAAA